MITINYLAEFLYTINPWFISGTFILIISSFILTYLNNRKSYKYYEINFEDEIRKKAKSISEQINIQNENENKVSIENGNSDFPANIDVTQKDKIFNEENLFELAVHQTVMEAHQKQAINHSRIQFYTGLIMSIIGFILIIYVVAIALSSNNSLISAITIVGSIVFEGISILFLKESHKLRQSAKEYHDNLSDNKKQLQAVKIAETIENPEIKSAIKAQLALHMIGIHSDNIDTTKIIEAMNK